MEGELTVIVVFAGMQDRTIDKSSETVGDIAVAVGNRLAVGRSAGTKLPLKPQL